MRASAGSAVWAVNHNLRHRDLFVSLSTQRSGWREIVLLRLLRPLALPQSHAWAASVLVDEFDASKLEGFTDSLNRLTRTGLLNLSKSTIESPSLATDASAGYGACNRVRSQLLKALRPAARPLINVQNLNDISLQSIGNDEGRLGDDEFTCAGDAAGTPHLRIFRK
jgi:hypothetical protein